MATDERASVAVCPGSFDPITYGHVDIIERASRLFERVIVSVAADSGKTGLFTIEERVELIRLACSHLPNIRVDQFTGLVVEHARRHAAAALVKGLRVVSDFEREMQMALMNRALADEIPIIFLMTHADYAFLSSSLVKEVFSLGGNISRFVPPAVEEALRAKLKPARGAGDE